MIEFIKGRSVTFTLSFNAEYDPTNIQDIVVKMGSDVIGQLTADTVLTTGNTRVFRVELTSAYTSGMREVSNLQVFLDDVVMGVRPFEQQQIRAYRQLDFSNSSVNEGSDFTLNLTVEEGSEEIAVDTVTIYNAISQIQVDDIEAFSITATTGASTATTQAGISTAQAVISTTQAGIATTKANEASVSAAGAVTTLSSSLLKANNLSDLVSASTARTNLGLGTLATQSGTFTDKANVASPIFTGTVSIPTLSVTNDATINGIRVGVGNFYNIGNLAIGSTSLASNISGSDNTAIGTATLTNLTSGNNNIALGRSAGRFISGGSTTLTISTNSIFLGNYAYPLANNQINQLVIGTGAIGLGSNTTVLGNSSTTFGRWWGNLVLGASENTGEPLQVTGVLKTGGLKLATSTKTGAYTITTNDHTIRCDATSAGFSVTLPSASTITGQVFEIKKIDSTANAITIIGTLDGISGRTISTQYASFTVQSNGTNYDIL